MEFKDKIKFFLDDNNEYSKEALYNAYVEMTENFLNELISTQSYENWIMDKFGEDRADDLMMDIASNYSPDMEDNKALSLDPIDRIEYLMDYIDESFGMDDEDEDEE